MATLEKALHTHSLQDTYKMNGKYKSEAINKEPLQRVFLALLIALTFITISTFTHRVNANTGPKNLVIFNWDNYMPEFVLDEFYKQTGYKVKQIYYDSEKDARELVLAGRGQGMDLMVLSRYELSVLAKQKDIFAPIPYHNLKTIKHLDPIWETKSANVFKIGFPWLWGTNGVIYRKDLVDLDTITWMDLMIPPASSEGKIMMIPSMRDTMSAALMALNESINTHDPEVLLQAGKLLQAQAKIVHAYNYVTSELISGDTHMSQIYSSDAVEFLSLNENITYTLPNNLTSVWLNSIAVFEASQHKDIAFKFIDFINDPERAAKIAELLASSPSNKTAKQYLSDDYLNEPSLNISREVLESAEMFEVLPPAVVSQYNAVFYNAIRAKL